MVTLYITDDVGSQSRGIKFPSSEFLPVMHTVTHMALRLRVLNPYE